MRVVLEFPLYERSLLQDEDGSLFVRESDGRLLAVEVDRPMSLIPLLEWKRDMYPAEAIATLPIRDMPAPLMPRERTRPLASHPIET